MINPLSPKRYSLTKDLQVNRALNIVSISVKLQINVWVSSEPIINKDLLTIEVNKVLSSADLGPEVVPGYVPCLGCGNNIEIGVLIRGVGLQSLKVQSVISTVDICKVEGRSVARKVGEDSYRTFALNVVLNYRTSRVIRIREVS